MTTVKVLDSDNDRYIYSIGLHDNKPLVELSYLVKAPSLLNDTNDNGAISGRRAEDLEVILSNSDVDLDTGELIENTLKHFLVFLPFAHCNGKLLYRA